MMNIHLYFTNYSKFRIHNYSTTKSREKNCFMTLPTLTDSNSLKFIISTMSESLKRVREQE